MLRKNIQEFSLLLPYGQSASLLENLEVLGRVWPAGVGVEDRTTIGFRLLGAVGGLVHHIEQTQLPLPLARHSFRYPLETLKPKFRARLSL